MSMFEKGNKVTIWRHHQPSVITTVGRMTARKMVLADGSEWTADGYRPWGAGRNGYSTAHVNHFKDRDAEILQRRLLLSKVRTEKWEDMETDRLVRIVAILREREND